MKIWFDILTPKQLLFFEPMIKKLRQKNDVLCTSRNYREVTNLIKDREFNVKNVGKHGGGDNFDKLDSSINRMRLLLPIIRKFSPDTTVSFCSPEASRISFGLGIRHIAFSDSPHAVAVMKLSIPFVDKLLIPWIIPKKEFEKFGIRNRDVIQYRAIDAATIIGVKNYKRKNIRKRKKIVFRIEEEQAAYIGKNPQKIINIIKNVSDSFPECNVIVLGRYENQIKMLKKTFGKKINVYDKVVNGKQFLLETNVFVGSGGTMTAESALLGVPTISYNAVPNLIEEYLVKKKLVIRGNNSGEIIRTIKQIIDNPTKKFEIRAKKEIEKMEDPYPKLLKTIRSK